MIEPAAPLPWPRPERQPVVDPSYDLGGYLPGAGWSTKQVIINDNLPAGVLYATEREIILSRRGWELLLARLEVINEARVAVSAIVERVMAAELAWLRGAGHDV